MISVHNIWLKDTLTVIDLLVHTSGSLLPSYFLLLIFDPCVLPVSASVFPSVFSKSPSKRASQSCLPSPGTCRLASIVIWMRLLEDCRNANAKATACVPASFFSLALPPS